MKRAKIITSNAELEEFLARTDIEIINVDIRSCEQSWFAQEYFTAVIYYYDEPKSGYSPDYWTKLEHQYAGMAMQGFCANYNDFTKVNDGTCTNVEMIVENARIIAHALVEKLKEKEERK